MATLPIGITNARTIMLEALITSKTRIKLMLKFFLNTSARGYLRGLETEFGESTNAIRLELNRFEQAGLLTSSTDGMRKMFQANTSHPLFADINSLVRKYVGMDDIIETVVHQLGDLHEVYLIGDLAAGIDGPDLSLLIVGNNIDLDYLEKLCAKAQKLVSRTLGYVVFSIDEFARQQPFLNKDKLLLVWKYEG
ncbi:MAG: ArsR family transcriptional regulator [Bacteroidales bacterium]|nr:ArsR family transcriptional regulator [Bacteroidales bacterium]